MISLFLGLSLANLLLLGLVFALGLATAAAGFSGGTMRLYALHVALGVTAGLMTALAHPDDLHVLYGHGQMARRGHGQGGHGSGTVVDAGLAEQGADLALGASAVILTMLAMFAGAAADPTVRPWSSGQVHLVMAGLAIAGNLICTLGEYRLIRAQGRLMDETLAVLNA